jgi:cytidine deaminase
LLNKAKVGSVEVALTNETLIERARSVVKPRKIRHGFIVGEVGCALVTNKENVYLGTSLDAASGMGFCAEHSVIAASEYHGKHSAIYKVPRVP